MKVSGLAILTGLGVVAAGAYVLTRKAPPPSFLPPKSSPPNLTTSVPVFTQTPQAPTAQEPLFLDPTLTAPEREAVVYALTRESDPQRLLGFAASWGLSAPLTTGLLRSRAESLSRRMGS